MILDRHPDLTTPSVGIRRRPVREWGRWLVVAVGICAALLPSGFGSGEAAEPLFAGLQKRLVADGMDRDLVQAIYRHPLVTLVPEVVAGNLKRKERLLNYQQFLAPYPVARARGYLDEHRPTLKRAERRHGVPPSVVVAILMVETALGTYPGKHLAINVLSTMAASNSPVVEERVLALVGGGTRQGRSREHHRSRLQKRAARSYRELKALIGYVGKNGTDPMRIFGSSEGAIGIPQFMPSNIERYGRDGDGNGSIDLFDHQDAIASVAFFLRAHGWGKAESPEGKKRVLLHYNHSTYYADAVYALAEKLGPLTSETGP
jgi:membrane-bound lytic murein transglycosylase B